MHGKSMSVLAGILVGVSISVLILIVGAVTVSMLISKEIVNYASMSYCVMAVTGFAAVCGSFAGTLVLKKQILLVSMSVALAMLLIMLSVTAMFFEGSYTGVPATAALVAGCSLSTALISAKIHLQPKKHHKKH